MSNFNDIPNQFQVFSTQPELRIRYSGQIWDKIFPLLFLLPFLAVFAGHCWILLLGLHETLNLHFWKAIQVLSYRTNNPWYLLIFVFTFFLMGVATWLWLWILLGVAEIHATQESLTIIYKMLRMSRKTSLLTRDIRYFNQFLKTNSEGNTWDLEVVTNQRLSDKDLSFPAWFPIRWISADMLVRMNYKTIHLYGHPNPIPSDWLGKVLAEFYKVEFQSTARSNHTWADRV